eukprot:3109519-Alexandrium_andersonii.AAC.1
MSAALALDPRAPLAPFCACARCGQGSAFEAMAARRGKVGKAQAGAARQRGGAETAQRSAVGEREAGPAHARRTKGSECLAC